MAIDSIKYDSSELIHDDLALMLAVACESRKPHTIDITKSIDTFRHSSERL